MEAPPQVPSATSDELFLSRAVEATIRIGLVIAIVAWCFEIVRPFAMPVAWAVVIAVAIHPVHVWLRTRLGGRGRLSAVLLVLLGLVVLVVPATMLGGTLVEGTQALAARLGEGSETQPVVPRPPESVRDWPLVGDSVYGTWARASQNLASVLEPLRPQLMSLGSWVLAAAAGAGLAFLQSLLSILIAGVLLANDESSGRAAGAIGRRLAGARGVEFATLAGATVRSVAQGILGVALIQAFLAGVGLLAAGVPGAGLWALIGLVLCVVQIGLLPVALPAMIYMFAVSSTGAAVVFSVWMLLVSLLDNFLKPLLLGRGIQVPTLVIFLGSIGGFLASGIIGLFVGAAVLVVGYTLFRTWLEQTPAPTGGTAVALDAGS